MSVTGSNVSMRPTSTIVGCRDIELESASQKISNANSVGFTGATDSETVRRETCTWFERKLDMGQFLRDKKNEERPQYERFIRINSKTLRCSYQIPVESVHSLLTRLYKALAPGLRVDARKKCADKCDMTEKEKKHLKILKNWYTCSDMTVQVFPKSPSVLWFDMECMKCKRGENERKRQKGHLKSKHIIQNVVAEVVECIKNYKTVNGNYDVLYVTRGKTCGLHIFFPYVTVDCESGVQDVWTAVNKRLERIGQTAAMVDTGCSAMPLPLCRHHNGLTRVEVNRSDNDGGLPNVLSYQLKTPSLKDLARVTNFYHFLDDVLNEHTPSPPSSIASGSSGCSDVVSRISTKRKREADYDGRESDTSYVDAIPTEQGAELKKTKLTVADDDNCVQDNVADIEQEQDAPRVTTTKFVGEKSNSGIACVEYTAAETVCESTPHVSGEEEMIENATSNNTTAEQPDVEIQPQEVADTEEMIENTATSDNTTPEQPDVEIQPQEDTDTLEKSERLSTTGSDHSERLSTASRGSKRLVQHDIREMYAKASKKARTPTTTTANSDTMDERTNGGNIGSDYDETVSSFVGRGYAPSAKSFMLTSADTTLTADNDEGSLHQTNHIHRISEKYETATTCPVVLPENLVNPQQASHPPAGSTTANLSPYTSLRALYVAETSPPLHARLPELSFARSSPTGQRRSLYTKEDFERNMQLRLDDHQNRTHKTDTQLIVSSFDTELQFYNSMMKNSTPVSDYGFNSLRIKDGGSLTANRDNCPAALFPEYVPRVLYAEDFVGEEEWTTVLVRYFDEYLNSAPFLYVMAHVLQNDQNVKNNLSETSRQTVHRCVQNCLHRFKYDVIGFQRKLDTGKNVKTSNVPKQPYQEKCTVVVGLMAICSMAYNMVTPVYTDLAKVCRMLLGNDKQTLQTLNASTVSTTTSNDRLYDSVTEDLFNDSVSQAGHNVSDAGGALEEENSVCDTRGGENVSGKNVSANIGNDHSIIASILRWNYPALGEQTQWCLFFYYYHVHNDGLSRIMDEVVHGGLMVTAVLQAYLEEVSNHAPVDVRLVCSQVYGIEAALDTTAATEEHEQDSDHRLMPPPSTSRGGRQRGKGRKRGLERKTGHVVRRRDGSGGGGGDGGGSSSSSSIGDGEEGEKLLSTEEDNNGNDDSTSSSAYKTSLSDVLKMFVHRYFRPVTFDETTVLYTESGYEPCQNEFSASFSNDKDRKKTVMDVFNRGTLKYSMPHGDLLLYNTDVMGTVHRRSTCTNNLVLNIFENMYGGCMTYLTRRYNNHLTLFNRFNGDAYRLVVECRHAMNELIQSIELSYINLILRLPIVPPVLEQDEAIRELYMSQTEILKGSFVCLNAMDYARAVNMFTRHSKFLQENCKMAESFLDSLITNRDVLASKYEDAGANFRTVYLFFLLYVFEVLYKIRHAYNRDRTYNVSIERLSMELDVRVLLKLFFGPREFQMPRGLSAEVMKLLDMRTNPYDEATTSSTAVDDYLETEAENRAAAARCINTRPVISTDLPDKLARMKELFGKKGIIVMKSYTPLGNCEADEMQQQQSQNTTARLEANDVAATTPSAYEESYENSDHGVCGASGVIDKHLYSCVERDQTFLNMPQAQLEEVLYSSATWYENCRVRLQATRVSNRDTTRGGASINTKELEMCMDAKTTDTFLRTQLSVNIDNDRLNDVERAVRENKDFAFCTHLPLRTKMIALVLATHSTKRMTTDMATEFVRKTYCVERSHQQKQQHQHQNSNTNDKEEDHLDRPDTEWKRTWNRLLSKRSSLLKYCRSMADVHFPHSYFIGLQPDNAYNALYSYMLSKPKYTTLHGLKQQPWAKDVCAALNYLLVTNAYDTELVELCLRLFLGFEWPGQWAKRIFVWKSNSNAGKSFLFEHILRKAFDQSTCINDPKGGKENAPEKSEYYKNFVLMINEFTTASAGELKKLCSTSSYKFRMNFGNQMIQAFMIGKMVFNCNTLPLTTDHATIQRVALVPLPFWFQKRQSVVDAMLNWTKDQSLSNEYEKNFRRHISQILTAQERQFFIDQPSTKNEDDLFNKPNDISLQLLGELSDQSVKASMFLVQNKTSQVYMMSPPPKGTIINGIVLITKYFCRFRFFTNNIKEPVDYSVLPTACTAAAHEWQRVSQPYFDWKERYRVHKSFSTHTKVSIIYASLNHFAKTYSKNASFFDLRQFFEWDFAEQKVPHFNAREDEYNVKLDPLED